MKLNEEQKEWLAVALATGGTRDKYEKRLQQGFTPEMASKCLSKRQLLAYYAEKAANGETVFRIEEDEED